MRFESAPFDDCDCLDPAGYDARTWPVLSLAYDGLVAYRRIPGAGGSTLVADLAESVPQPRDGGRTYTFQLRPGLRFSDGTPVRPDGLPRVDRARRAPRRGVRSPPFYGGIVGADACSPRRCDLSKGIETDAAARTITIHLRRPDTEFAHKLALPLAYVLPARAPATLIRGASAAGNGPVQDRRLRAGPQCAPGAQPALSLLVGRGAARRLPRRDHRIDLGARRGRRWRPCSTAAPTPSSPSGGFGGQLPLAQDRALALTAASRVHTAPEPNTNWLFLERARAAVR